MDGILKMQEVFRRSDARASCKYRKPPKIAFESKTGDILM